MLVDRMSESLEIAVNNIFKHLNYNSPKKIGLDVTKLFNYQTGVRTILKFKTQMSLCLKCFLVLRCQISKTQNDD